MPFKELSSLTGPTPFLIFFPFFHTFFSFLLSLRVLPPPLPHKKKKICAKFSPSPYLQC